MFSRRALLRRAALLSLAPTVPCFLARTARAARADRDGRVLVVVQLDGGNDGINSVVPCKDEGYAKNRPTLRLPTDQLHRINDTLGFHPSMGDAARLLESGRLTVVQGVGYPNPSRSHARSMAVWQTARLDADDHTGHGWLGRALDGSARPHTGAPGALFLGTEAPPRAVVGRSAVASALAQIEDFTLPLTGPAATAVAGPAAADDLTAYVRRSLLDGYLTADWLREAGRPDRSTVRYPETDLAGRLKTVAALLRAGLGARVFYTAQPGYDTHSSQQFTHA